LKLDHEERPLRGARQGPAVELGNLFRCEANVKRALGSQGHVESLQLNPRLVAECMTSSMDWSAAAILADSEDLWARLALGSVYLVARRFDD
jgi:hypothetical protein